MEQYEHTDRDGDRVRIGDSRAGAYVQLRPHDQKDGPFPTAFFSPSQALRMAAALYEAVGLEWHTPRDRSLCGAMYSPDPDTRYDCSRRSQHMGPHMDDGQNTMWISSLAATHAEYRMLDPRTEAEKRLTEPAHPAVPEADSVAWENLYRDEHQNRDRMFMGLVRRVEALEQGAYADGPAGGPAPWEVLTQHMSSQTTAVLESLKTLEYGVTERLRRINGLVAQPLVCGEPSTAHEGLGDERCALDKGHAGRHREGLSTWPQPAVPSRTCAQMGGEPWCTRPANHSGLCKKRPAGWVGDMDRAMDAGGHVQDESGPTDPW